MVGECLALLLHKAAQEGERDEAEEDDKENSTADHSLGLWATAQQQGAEEEEERGVVTNCCRIFRKPKWLSSNDFLLLFVGEEGEGAQGRGYHC